MQHQSLHLLEKLHMATLTLPHTYPPSMRCLCNLITRDARDAEGARLRALAMEATQAEAAHAEATRARQRAMVAEMRADNDRLLAVIAQQRQRDAAEEAARQGWWLGGAGCGCVVRMKTKKKRTTSGGDTTPNNRGCSAVSAAPRGSPSCSSGTACTARGTGRSAPCRRRAPLCGCSAS